MKLKLAVTGGKEIIRLVKHHGIGYYLVSSKYLSYVRKKAIQPNTILLESQHGSQLNGNIFHVVKELTHNPAYTKYKIFVAVQRNKADAFRAFIEKNPLPGAILVERETKQYFQLLASAKYLINDNTFLPHFIKKDGQVYLNTWHGTPLKTLGKKIANDRHNIGNAQKNFLVADYLLYTNQFTMDHMIEDYMLADLSKGKVLLSGYPRNTAFFHDSNRESLRQKYHLEDKQVIAYMPTWRGTFSNVGKKAYLSTVNKYLNEIDKQLDAHQVMYVNLHPLIRSQLEDSKFEHIKCFPEHVETYDFLNCSDMLITDYSSVFFDYSVTGRKIIMFVYDQDKYLRDRGMYLDIDQLPFPKVKNVEELMCEIRKEKDYDDTDFLKTYCPYEHAHVARDLCERVILGKSNTIEELDMPSNHKENVLIYVGNLDKNGITASVRSLMQNVDLDKRNYFLTFVAGKVGKANQKQLLSFPEAVRYIGTTGKMNLSLFQELISPLYHFHLIPFSLFLTFMEKTYPYEIKRSYGDIHFSHVIQFTGYGFQKLMQFSHFDTKRIIYIHNNMIDEIRLRGNQDRKTLEYNYKRYDKLAVVTEDMIASAKSFCSQTEKFALSQNLINYQTILSRSEVPLGFDKKTTLNMSTEKALDMLQNTSCKKFINIGRFSVEKGQLRLLDAFNRIWKESPQTCLVIVGGYGDDYKRIVEHSESLPCKDNILIIRSVNNPYSILKACDYFVLSSLHEGFGIVLAEADILGLPVISTDIEGPRGFMKEHGGTLVENSENGLFEGMKDLLENKISPMNVDYEAYNQMAVQQFENMLDDLYQ